jgi:hypothetical protein
MKAVSKLSQETKEKLKKLGSLFQKLILQAKNSFH